MIWRAFPVLMLCLWCCLPDPLEVKNIPQVKPEIVVSSQIVPDQSLVVLLTRTIGALEASDDTDPFVLLTQVAVNDARVILFGPSRTDTLLFVGNGIYVISGLTFTERETYTLHVSSVSLGEVTASTEVKPRVNFSKIEALLNYDNPPDTFAQVSYTLEDLEGRNYYMINVYELEPETLLQNAINPRAFTRLMTDEAFAGQTYVEQFRVYSRSYSAGDTIAVSLSNISEAYYRFMELRIDNRFNFIEFLSEPLNYPSNVKGGKGFFNLYVPDIRLFVLK